MLLGSPNWHFLLVSPDERKKKLSTLASSNKISWCPLSQVSTPTTSLEAQLSFEDAQIEMLIARVQELEAKVNSSSH